jgi:hypothetical protein
MDVTKEMILLKKIFPRNGDPPTLHFLAVTLENKTICLRSFSVSIAEYLKLGSLYRHLFLIIFEAERFKSRILPSCRILMWQAKDRERKTSCHGTQTSIKSHLAGLSLSLLSTTLDIPTCGHFTVRTAIVNYLKDEEIPWPVQTSKWHTLSKGKSVLNLTLLVKPSIEDLLHIGLQVLHTTKNQHRCMCRMSHVI